MNKLVGVLGTLALVVSVMPTATAELDVASDARDLTIDVTGPELPVTLGSLDYPFYAAERGMAGQCSVELNVNADGSAASYNVSECSHATFRRAAESFARSANFAPGANEEVHELTISWQPVN
ncbi:energy transducer TonB [Ponticaulis sp.]|uniref:energy transducer TonB n=1 Tax=Ponticaulis sp. TaxID=2020902 RepID=UPI000B722448|nr:energy transducer TonB [Ponticaulis sp.]MAI91402.1 hypothetical protein [Ponticaulis sp.]OUX97762.1 MAG: hypothetical protein CBB65_13245 [Hyphomonadaceae bacterium TMED5]|tara:strand:- start:8670 stop:9038 length:369 start_codon:yes stop_codon:yes gene_type:complete